MAKGRSSGRASGDPSGRSRFSAGDLRKMVNEAISVDAKSWKNGVLTARQGYFYRGNRTEEAFASRVLKDVKSVVPSATLVDSWDKYADFRGGATVARQSHFGVRVKVPGTE